MSSTKSSDPAAKAYYGMVSRQISIPGSAGLQALGHDYTTAHREALLRTYRPAQTLTVQGLTHVKNQVQRDYFVERGFIAFRHLDGADEFLDTIERRELRIMRSILDGVPVGEWGPPEDSVTLQSA